MPQFKVDLKYNVNEATGEVPLPFPSSFSLHFLLNSFLFISFPFILFRSSSYLMTLFTRSPPSLIVLPL